MQRAVSLMGRNTLRQLAEDDDDDHEKGDDREKGDESENDEPSFGLTDIVAVVEPNSTDLHPLIILAKILRIDRLRREVLLAHLAPVSDDADGRENIFRLVVGRGTWKESFDAVVYPIDVRCSNTGLYTLLTPAEDIHKVIHPK